MRLLQKLQENQVRLRSEVNECIKNPEVSPLRIACSTNFGVKYVLPTLQENASAFSVPQVSLVRSSAAITFLEKGQADFAFVALPKAPRGFRWLFLKKDQAVIAGRKGRFDHIRKVKSIAALNNEPWVYLATSNDASPLAYAGRSGFAVHGIFELRTLILGGHAIGVTRVDNYSEAEQKQLVYAPVIPREEKVSIYLIHQPTLASRKRKLMMELVERLKVRW